MWLDLADSQYVGEKQPHSPIRAALLDALERAAPATVVAPLGLSHPDRVAVADVCRGLVRSLDADWYCYPDMSYAQSVLGALHARLREVDRHVRLECAADALEAPSVKADAVACYASQVAALRAVLSGSLREELAETLTIARLGVSPTLARNAIESMIEICLDHSANVKRWRDGTMALRWCAAGMNAAAKQFRRVNGYLHLPAIRAALHAHFKIAVTPTCETDQAAA